MPRLIPLLCLALVAACSEGAVAPAHAPDGQLARHASGAPVMGHYVAMGTSVSMGVMSSGVVASDQAQSWPAQLAALANVPFTQPLVAAPGCQPPLAAPLASLRRVNGESPFVRSAVCSPLASVPEGPVQNLALSEAVAFDALLTTPERAPRPDWPLRGEFYSRVLGPGQTQLSAMLAQRPDIVSLELGANEVLGSRSGLLAPGVTYLPTPMWRLPYDQIVAGVKSTGAKVLLVGLISDVATFPSLRRGQELADDAEAFARLGITVSDNCSGAARDNHIYVAALVVGTYAAALQAKANGQPAPVLSCADVPGTQDYILTPADIAVLDAQLAEMNAHVNATAAVNGWALFHLDVLYARRDLKAPFSVDTLLFSHQPYGRYISLDGVHPTGEGHRVFTREAARALNRTYHLAIPPAMADIAVAH